MNMAYSSQDPEVSVPMKVHGRDVYEPVEVLGDDLVRLLVAWWPVLNFLEVPYVCDRGLDRGRFRFGHWCVRV